MFDNKIALVTGAGSGIGWAVASQLLTKGAKVALCDLSPKAAEDLLKSHPQAKNGVVFAVDVADEAAVETLVTQVVETLGTPDVLVNCAGIREICYPLDLDFSTWNKILSVNLSGSFLMAQRVGRAMVAAQKSGAIVNVASTAGLVASRDRAAYVASKHGVVGLTKQLAYDLGKHQIRVNAVAPAVIRTALTASYFTDLERAEAIYANYPLGRVGLPEEVANAICFLASSEASFISGVTLPVDGGNSAGKR